VVPLQNQPEPPFTVSPALPAMRSVFELPEMLSTSA
jgi:hypothetical protein